MGRSRISCSRNDSTNIFYQNFLFFHLCFIFWYVKDYEAIPLPEDPQDYLEREEDEQANFLDYDSIMTLNKLSELEKLSDAIYNIEVTNLLFEFI